MRNAKAWTLLLPITILATILVLLAGCSSTSGGSDSLVEDKIRLSDGREIICVIWDGYNAGSVVCDWDHPLSNINGSLEDEQ